MRCDQVLPQLNALVDGELNGLRARAVQQHLRGCPACAEEKARIQQIGEQARQWRAVSAPAGLRTRIVQAQAQSSERGAELPFSTKEQTIMEAWNTSALPLRAEAASQAKSKQELSPSRSRFAQAWRPVLALSGIGLTAGIFALTLAPTHKTVAWAAVRQAMQRVRTIHWNEQVSGVAVPGFVDKPQTVNMDAWARLDQPACAMLTPQAGMRTLYLPGKEIMLIGDQTIMDLPLPGLGGEHGLGMREFILDQIISPGKDAAANVSGDVDASQLPNKIEPGIKSEETVLNGRPTVRFYADYRSETWHLGLSVWVDPETQLVVRSETVMSGATPGQPEERTVADQFRYNEPPPAGIFDLPQKK